VSSGGYIFTPIPQTGATVTANPLEVGTGALRTSTTSIQLNGGQTQDLSTFLRTPGGSLVSQTVVWTSSNDSVATVGTTTGVVRAVGNGTAVVTGSLASDPSSRVKIGVSVFEKHTVLLVKVVPATPVLKVGQSLPLKAQVTMADGQVNGNVSWSSSDNTLAVVNPTTGEVTGLREGKVTIVAAYSADPRYKGLAELEVVTELRATPTPLPAEFIFRPGATPLPGPDVRPGIPLGVSSPSPTTGLENGLTTEPSNRFRPPNFAAVKVFSRNAVYNFIDFKRVVVADGTTISITSDAGATWTTYKNLVTQQIFALHWRSENEGWISGANGTAIKVQINAGKASLSVSNTGTNSVIVGIYFTSPLEGVIANQPAKKTLDGGKTWESLGTYGGEIQEDGMGSLLIRGGYGNYSYNRYKNGALEPISVGSRTSFEKIVTAPGIALLLHQEDRGKDGWNATNNWKDYSPTGKEFRTPTQILRPAYSAFDLYPISKSEWISVYQEQSSQKFNIIITRDGGETWSDPEFLAIAPGRIKPFSATQMWGVDLPRSGESVLYRAGDPD
jgi:hypothetical protein